MIRGDLSNEVPPRVLVTLDAVTIPEVQVTKVLGIIPKVHNTFRWDVQFLAYLWHWTGRNGANLELAVIGDEYDPAEVEDSLDAYGTNPFRWVTAYESVQQIVDQLPYRMDLIGVVDTPERMARYGTWGIELEK